MNQRNWLILLFILLGIAFRLVITQNGAFIFNQDNARDLVDVREMVILKDIRLIGPNSSIEGLFQGVWWYYILSIPFILSGGNPYSEIILMILIWSVGAYFLFKLFDPWNLNEFILVGILWIFSNYILLITRYAFNPNPITLLLPMFLYYFNSFIRKPTRSNSIIVGSLIGLIFNFEIAFGIFFAICEIITVYVLNREIFRNRKFILAGLSFIFFLLPEIAFEIKNHFLMSQAVLKYIFQNTGRNNNSNILYKFIQQINTYHQVLNGGFVNSDLLLAFSIALILFIILRGKIKDILSIPIIFNCLLIAIGSFLFYIIFPINVMLWHIGAIIPSIFILLGYSLYKLSKISFILYFLFLLIFFGILGVSIFNNVIDDLIFKQSQNSDPSLFKNEINTLDYVYNAAKNQPFKVYTYIPSVYDYPYQYLFWWYGLNTYYYLPDEYAYAPNVPTYIYNDSYFKNKLDRNTNLIFLIIQSDNFDRINSWKNMFTHFKMIKSENVGPFEIDTLNVK